MRVRRIGQGGQTRQEDLSAGLNVTTNCTDVTLPFPRAAPVADRAAIAQQALAAIPPTDYDPFDPQTVLRTSNADDCLAWPNDPIRAPFTGPLPDVPALLLGGRLDTRTPLENARATAQELPHSTIVALKGSGHDALDSDITGCTAEALSRFIEDVAVGHPCLNQDNGVRPTPLPPRSLADFRSAPGVGGDRGRALFAVLDTVTDARLAALQTLFAGLQVQGGGLRGGSFSGEASFEGRLRLRQLRLRPRPARDRLALDERGDDLGHRPRERQRPRNAAHQPPWLGDRHARRAPRELPPHAPRGGGHAARRRLAVAADVRAAPPARRALITPGGRGASSAARRRRSAPRRSRARSRCRWPRRRPPSARARRWRGSRSGWR